MASIDDIATPTCAGCEHWMAEVERLRAIVEPLRFFDSILRERGWGDAEALEQAYRRVMWRLGDYEAALGQDKPG